MKILFNGAYYFFFLAGLLACHQAQAAMAGVCVGSEPDLLNDWISHAKIKIDIRSLFVEDHQILEKLRAAAKRGVKIRIVVDTVSPMLVDLLSTSKGTISVHVISKTDPSQYLEKSVTPTGFWDIYGKGTKRFLSLPKKSRLFIKAKGPEAYATIDYIQSWYGTPHWSPKGWVGICTEMIHTRSPDPKIGSKLFVEAWQHSSNFVRSQYTGALVHSLAP